MDYTEAQSSSESMTATALIPIDGTDIYYTKEQASNFDEVFGTNTNYTIDPEECMADNFADAMQYGMDGKNGQGTERCGMTLIRTGGFLELNRRSLRSSSCSDEIFKHLFPVRRHDRLGMELHSVNRIIRMLYRHHLSVCGDGGYF